jgi:hypothetical protein
MTGHGFRATARTLIRERLGYDKEIVERHLAHGSDEALRNAYDRTKYLEQRTKMAQDWADYLDRLAIGLADGIALDTAGKAALHATTTSDYGVLDSRSI